MTFLPIVARELRVASRQRGTHAARFGAALLALLAGGWIMLWPDLRSPRVLGITLFVTLSVLTYLYSLFAGVFKTTDCLAEEKREGTLGLLFLTDLKGYDIVLGKLAATSLNTFYGMLAIFPIMAISLLAGGVTVGEFWRVVLVSVNNLFFSLAVGMFCSAISRDERKAMVLAFLILLFLAGGLPLINGFVSDWGSLPAPALLFIPSPGYAAFMAFDLPFTRYAGSNYFYTSVACTHVLAWGLLAAASFIVPWTWQDRSSGAATGRAFLLPGEVEERRAWRTRLLAINPFYWLAARDRFKSARVIVVLWAVGDLWAWSLSNYPDIWQNGFAYCCTAIVTHAVVKFWLVFTAVRRVGNDRRSGALELLLSTPLTVPQILQGQMLALRRHFALPAALVVASDFVFLLANRNDGHWVLTWTVLIVVFVADLITLSWVGVWLGLTSRNTTRAAGAALVRVLVLPWMIFAALLTVVGLADLFPSGSEGSFVILAGLLIALAVDFYFGITAWRKLRADFRTVATQRFESRSAKKFAATAAPPVLTR